MSTVQRTELHRHLDASFRPSTLVTLVNRLQIPAPFKTAKEVREKFWITSQMKSLAEVLACFEIFQKVLRTQEILEQVAFEAVEDAALDGIQKIELRYSPSFTSEFSGLSWKEALDSFSKGIQQGAATHGIRAGLICIASREYGLEAAIKTVEFALENRGQFIGVDLAGNEEAFPNRNYASAFRRAVDAGMPVTIHAGEACGPESIWQAIDELGARRIGHGITATRDEKLIQRLARDGILLETCPTSNYVTRSVNSFAEHPLPKFLAARIPVSISTDEPGIFGVTLTEEQAIARKHMGLSGADIAKTEAFASSHSFLPG